VRSRIEVLLAEDAKKRSKQWFWVHHAPPAGSPTSWDGNSYRGDVELEQWIGQYKPDAVLCGHVHQSPLRPGGSWVDRIGSTLVFNPGRQYGRPPTHIILDSAHQTGLWFSEAGNQYVRLDQTPIRAEDLTELPEWLRVTRRDHDPSLLVLLADQALQGLPDHSKMSVLPDELLVQIDEIACGRIQPLCEQPRDEKGDLGVGSEKVMRIVEDMKLYRKSCRHGDGVRPIHKQRHFTEYRARLLDRSDVNIAP
jgi:hypothetical protein